MNKPRYSPVKNYIVPLTSIMQHDAEKIKRTSEALLTRGYVFIRLLRERSEQATGQLIWLSRSIIVYLLLNLFLIIRFNIRKSFLKLQFLDILMLNIKKVSEC